MIERQHGKYLHRRDDALIAQVLLIKERQFAMTDEIECTDCDGHGCVECNYTGWRPMTDDELDAAAERQAEDAASEPPVTMDEMYCAAFAQKMELRR